MTRRRVIHAAAAGVAACAIVVCAQRAVSPFDDQVRAVAVALAAAGLGPILILALWRIGGAIGLEHRLRASSTAGVVAGVSVRCLDAEAPFVAGIVRPAIYWPRHLTDTLSPRERRAVVLHEEHHRKHATPRRLMVLGLISTLAPARVLTSYLDLRRAVLEIEADAGALAAGATRGALASALLRLAPTAAAHGAGFTAASDLRIRTLLGDPGISEPGTRSPIWVTPAVALLVTILCFVGAG